MSMRTLLRLLKRTSTSLGDDFFLSSFVSLVGSGAARAWGAAAHSSRPRARYLMVMLREERKPERYFQTPDYRMNGRCAHRKFPSFLSFPLPLRLVPRLCLGTHFREALPREA